eukprot:5168855-Pleurochrysis_carterae.AAC.1
MHTSGCIPGYSQVRLVDLPGHGFRQRDSALLSCAEQGQLNESALVAQARAFPLMCVRTHVCVRACARACVRTCVRARVRACVRTCV